MKLNGKILTFIIILVMMVNAVGIAQVTHICKLAVAGIEKHGCIDSPTNSHSCCPESSEYASGVNTNSENCCTDIIKYYHQKVDITIQQSPKVQSLNLFISLFVVSLSFEKTFKLTDFVAELSIAQEKTGKTILIDIQTFLI